ncbi:L-histidine N(alpha)-methyltransferase [Wenzhouxiangella limi]|uniref:L-histidine N(Alpha)-methyltransferase n=1 Tax=Wenzhouxiangella limi TaxID=2707351 RepID=A0A845V0R1_9GAMM|nr:L-histidine N(alpha)-methyltransferase [Wenzhouxiangella limi]NDY96152.1 L-histidine N(alpha)-methyltransferase [Wenzhouxiangella limi]
MARSPGREEFLRDVLAGLSSSPKSLPCKYFYDARGSELFEAICECPEYYVTRADLALHEAHLSEISAMIGPGAHVIEFGSGAGVKTRKLLAALERPRAYTPIEISASALAASARDLETAFPDIEIRPLKADYTLDIDADRLNLDPPSRRRVIYFPGSTIGNFDHPEALAFLKRMARIARSGGAVLIGVDLMKPERQLIAAYDDAQGITAAFNQNLLARMQRDLDASIELDAFAHEARFNPEESRIEMHLVARRPTRIEVGGQSFDFAGGDTIHTESSHKYSVKDFRALAARAGLKSAKVWKDPDGLFSMHWLETT